MSVLCESTKSASLIKGVVVLVAAIRMPQTSCGLSVLATFASLVSLESCLARLARLNSRGQ